MKYFFVRQLTSYCRISDIEKSKVLDKEPQVNYTDIDGDIHEKKKDAENEKYTLLYELMKNLSDVGKIDLEIDSISDLKIIVKQGINKIWLNENNKSLELSFDNNIIKLIYKTSSSIANYDFIVEEIEEENIMYLFAKQNLTYRDFKPDMLSIIGTNREEILDAIDFVNSNDNDRFYYDYNLQIIDKSNETAFNKLIYLCCEKVFIGEFHPTILDIFDKDTIHNMKDKIRLAFLQEYHDLRRENNRLHYEKMMLNSKIQQLEDELYRLKYPEHLILESKDNYLFEKPRNFKKFENTIINIPF